MDGKIIVFFAELFSPPKLIIISLTNWIIDIYRPTRPYTHIEKHGNRFELNSKNEDIFKMSINNDSFWLTINSQTKSEHHQVGQIILIQSKDKKWNNNYANSLFICRWLIPCGFVFFDSGGGKEEGDLWATSGPRQFS